jgi:tetratricopeptide (TPR) repeat protein
MSIKSYFAEKLSNLLFLDVKKETINSLFNLYLSEDLYMPIKSSEIINSVKKGEKFEDISLIYFIEGMFYVLGLDSQFRFNDVYKSILLSKETNLTFIKGKIYDAIKRGNLEDAYAMLKGLFQVEASSDTIKKLLTLADAISEKNNLFEEELIEIIELGKHFENFSIPYLYEAQLYKKSGEYVKALNSINNYKANGGEDTPEVIALRDALQVSASYDKGKELLYDNPKESLANLIPLLDQFSEDATLYYYVAVGYRLIQNYEKAIYYLNQAMFLDNQLVDVVNELGLNYASLGDFNTAVSYFRKAFEATKSIEICTNLIMCYINLGDKKQAKLHLDIAKIINPSDEIIKDIEKIL